MLQEVDSWLLHFSNDYLKSAHSSDIVLMSRKIKEMQEHHEKFQKLAQETMRKFMELSVKQSKSVHPAVTNTSPTQVILLLIMSIVE